MAETSIEWTDRVWNFLAGCSLESPGCTHCYAMRQAARIERMNPGLAHYQGLTKPSKSGPVWTGRIGIAEHKLTEPLRVRKPAMWFVNSMSDLFHENVPDEWIDRVFAVMALTPHHTFQVLTKRSKRMREYLANPCRSWIIAREFLRMWGILRLFPKHIITDDNYPLMDDQPDDHPLLRAFPLPNVWLGVSVEDQQRADERIPDLLETPAAVRWISAEPLLGPLNLMEIDYAAYVRSYRPKQDGFEAPFGLHEYDPPMKWPALGPFDHWPSGYSSPGLDWVVVGGESGPNARPMHPDWARSLRDQCATAGVPFFMKQMSGVRKSAMPPIPDDLVIREFPNAR